MPRACTWVRGGRAGAGHERGPGSRARRDRAGGAHQPIAGMAALRPLQQGTSRPAEPARRHRAAGSRQRSASRSPPPPHVDDEADVTQLLVVQDVAPVKDEGGLGHAVVDLRQRGARRGGRERAEGEGPSSTTDTPAGPHALLACKLTPSACLHTARMPAWLGLHSLVQQASLSAGINSSMCPKPPLDCIGRTHASTQPYP